MQRAVSYDFIHGQQGKEEAHTGKEE